MAHRFVAAGAASAEPSIKYDENTTLERSGFGRALKTGGVPQIPLFIYNSICGTAGFKALDLIARNEHKHWAAYGLRVAERNGAGLERKDDGEQRSPEV